MCGPLDSWRGAVVGIDRIVVVLEGEEREAASLFQTEFYDETVAIWNKEIAKKIINGSIVKGVNVLTTKLLVHSRCRKFS